MIGGLAFSIAFACLNRARGSKLYDLTTSTTHARLAATMAMAALVLLASASWRAAVWAWAALFLWAVPEWGKYMGAACGNPISPVEPGFMLSEWAVKKSGVRGTRLKGLVGTAARMALAAPCAVAVALLTGGPLWPAVLTPFMALPYFALGYVTTPGPAWKHGEYCAGAILGVILYISIG